MLIQACLENLGPALIDSPDLARLVEPTLDFLLQHFLKSVMKSTKKIVLRNVKYVLMLVSGFASAHAEQADLS